MRNCRVYDAPALVQVLVILDNFVWEACQLQPIPSHDSEWNNTEAIETH